LQPRPSMAVDASVVHRGDCVGEFPVDVSHSGDEAIGKVEDGALENGALKVQLQVTHNFSRQAAQAQRKTSRLCRLA